MKQKRKPLILLRILINLILVATAALLVECVVFQFPALYYKEKPQDIICDGSDPQIEIRTKNALAKLSDEEIRSIEVEQSNQKLLAEYQGEVYEEKLDENLVKKDGTLCCCVILLIAFIATWSEVDYEWRGILVIVVFYLFGVSDKISFPFSKMMQLLCAFPLMTYYGAWGALLVCFILFLYNGVRGFINGSVAKYGFYVFYPLHLFIIFAITKKMV